MAALSFATSKPGALAAAIIFASRREIRSTAAGICSCGSVACLLVKGKVVTGFTDSEDNELDLSQHLLFSLEQALIANGANFKRSNANWTPNVVEEGALITGQNPASAAPIAEVLANRLS